MEFSKKIVISSQLKQIGTDLLMHLKEKFNTNLVALVFYGSRIRGTNFPESDLDVLIILNELDEREMNYSISNIYGELTRKYFIKVSPYSISKADFEFGSNHLFPFNLGVYLNYDTIFGEDFIEFCHSRISTAIQTGKLKVYPRSGIFIQR